MTVVLLFDLGRGVESEFAVEAAMVEPFDVDEGGEFELFDGAPWSFRPDEFGLVEPDSRFRHRIDASISVKRFLRPRPGELVQPGCQAGGRKAHVGRSA